MIGHSLRRHKCDTCGHTKMLSTVRPCGCGGWMQRYHKVFYSVVRFSNTLAIVELRECENGELEVSDWLKFGATEAEARAVFEREA